MSGSHSVGALFVRKLLWELACSNMSQDCARHPITIDALRGTSSVATFINYPPITDEFNCSARSISPLFIHFYGTIPVQTFLCGLSICSVGRNEINSGCMCNGLCLCVLSEMSAPPRDSLSNVLRCPNAARYADFVFLLNIVCCPPPIYLFIFVHAICHVAFSVLWVPHVHGQGSTQPRISSLVLFHAVWHGSSLCPLFLFPTRCAAHLLFMNTCKASSSEANGTGTLPRFTVNNAFATKLQSFKGIDGL